MGTPKKNMKIEGDVKVSKFITPICYTRDSHAFNGLFGCSEIRDGYGLM